VRLLCARPLHVHALPHAFAAHALTRYHETQGFRGHQPYGFFGAGLPISFTGGTFKMWTRPCSQCMSPNCTTYGVAPSAVSYPRFIMEADRLATRFESFLAEADANRPVFVQISFRAVHVPYVASPALRANCSLFNVTDSICQRTPVWKKGKTALTSKQLDYFGAVVSIDLAMCVLFAAAVAAGPLFCLFVCD